MNQQLKILDVLKTTFLYKIYRKLRGPLPSDIANKTLMLFSKSEFKKIHDKDIEFWLRINPENGFVDKEVYLNGLYEPKVCKIIRKYVVHDSICLDIGANIGHHSLFLSRVAYTGKVYAFEPMPKLINQMKESIEKNGIHNIELCNFGLSNLNEKKKAFIDSLNMGRTTFHDRKEETTAQDLEVQVFDEYWNYRSKIDFIKMDVEGYEYYALQGMKKSIERYRPVMLIEFTPLYYLEMGLNSSEILRFIFGLGYTIYDIENENREIKLEDLFRFIQDTPIQTNILCDPS